MCKILKFLSMATFLILTVVGMAEFTSFPLAQTKEKPLQYEIEVVLIEVPLYATDKEGNPVLDLKPEELTIYENGQRQEISHFLLVQNDSPQIASLARQYPASRRQFLLLFDFAFATPPKIIKAREACLKFIKEQIFPTDLVAVAAYSGIGGLKILSHFSSDRDHLYYIVNSLGLVESKQRMTGPVGFSFPKITEPSRVAIEIETKTVRDMADQELAELQEKLNKKRAEIYKAYVADFITDMKKLSLALDTIQGRKHIIYFSEGFDSKVLTGKSLTELSQDTDAMARGELFIGSRDIEGRFGDAALRIQLYDALSRISSADCPIHSIDIGGLRTQAGTVRGMRDTTRDIAAIRRNQDTLSLFSMETGGQVYKNVNELDKPLENLLQITNTYYILGYYPEDKKTEGNFRKIKIETARDDVHISYRKGYYEAKPYSQRSALEKSLQLVEHIVKDIDRSEIQFDSFVSAFRGREGVCQVPVFMKFPGWQFLEKNKRIQLEIYGFAISSNGVFKDFFHQDLSISPKTVKEKMELYGIKFYDLHLLPPGDYRIKLIVRDKDTGEIGSQFHEISVPNYDSGNLAVSGPAFIQPETDWLLIRGYDPNKPTGRKLGLHLPVDYPYALEGKPFIPGVVPVLQAISPAQFYLRIYNLRLHPQTQAPQTEMNFEIVDKDAQEIALRNVGLLQQPKQIEPGVFELIFQANFKDLPSGPYQLKLSLRDSLADQEVISTTPFIIE